MAKKKTPKRRQTPAPEPTERPAITAERFTRLYRLLSFLGEAARSRDWLIGKLDLDVRGFYRDLDFLKKIGITIRLGEGGYVLSEAAEAAIGRLPFPDPHLNLAEARQLAKGRSATHRRLQEQIDRLQT